jgi:hypothetical protein
MATPEHVAREGDTVAGTPRFCGTRIALVHRRWFGSLLRRIRVRGAKSVVYGAPTSKVLDGEASRGEI